MTYTTGTTKPGLIPIGVARVWVTVAVLLLILGGVSQSVGSQIAYAASPSVASISAGGLHTCAVTNGGAAWCWGHNARGQLGDGTTTNRSTPVRVQLGNGFLTDVKAISAGRFHTCAVKTDGSVWCWGDDAYGQLGDGTTGNADGVRLTPTKVLVGKKALTGATAVSAGFRHTCARTSDGEVSCWGANDSGQIGDGSMVVPRLTATPVKQGKRNLDGVVDVSAGGFHTCVATTDGAAWCWGLDQYGELGDGTTGDKANVRLSPVRVLQGGGNLSGVVGISAGQVHTCAVTAGGAAWCWGRGDSGQIGDGATSIRLSAVRVRDDDGPFGNVDVIDAGYSHSCAVKANGSAWCWGESTGGKLGDGSPVNISAIQLHPVRVITGNGTLDDVRSVSASIGDHSCAVTRSDVAWCWGANVYGRLGDGTTQSRPVAVPVQFD